LSVKVLALSTDFIRNITEVRIQITENIGRIERIKDELVVPIDGRFEIINEEMMDPFPEGEQVGNV
jgi:hypothetical protein